uniref:cysteine desulfurase n=1 Tax=Euplotes vannus TaxID=5939 RepID=Q6A1P0_EUPVA|nr:tRNA splicing protein SPL1 [Euplotes vannus]
MLSRGFRPITRFSRFFSMNVSVGTPGEKITTKGVQFGEAGKPIYLDNQATTPLDPRVLDAMMPYMTNQFGNPHSRSHSFGWETEKAVEKARRQLADLIGAEKREIIFTSGATESNNNIIKGVANFYKSRKNHIITSQIEHKCVLDSCRFLERQGFEVDYLPVNENGLIDLDQLRETIRPTTSIASIMMCNNKIGVVQPVKEIGQICREHKVFFHTDAAQAVGKMPVNVNDMNLDLISISGHKLYGPKGVGAMYIRRRPRVRLKLLMSAVVKKEDSGSGTLAPHLVVGLGAAAHVCSQEMDNDHRWISHLKDRFQSKITAELTHIKLNGDEASRYCGNLNYSFAGVEGESLLMAMKQVAISSGSACTSASLEPSYVLRALGLEDDMAHTSMRFGFGRFTTEEEVDFAADNLITAVKRLREMSPLWDMIQEGIDLSSINWTQPH